MFENHVVSDPDFQIYFHHWRDFAWLCEKYQIRHFGIQTGVARFVNGLTYPEVHPRDDPIIHTIGSRWVK